MFSTHKPLFKCLNLAGKEPGSPNPGQKVSYLTLEARVRMRRSGLTVRLHTVVEGVWRLS